MAAFTERIKASILVRKEREKAAKTIATSRAARLRQAQGRKLKTRIYMMEWMTCWPNFVTRQGWSGMKSWMMTGV